MLLFAGLWSALDSQPAWVKQRPVDTNYYTGIGSALLQKENYLQEAKTNALNDLASEINTNVSGVTINSLMETNAVTQEDFRSQVVASTQAELEGFELVDSWKDSNRYWVYYRLSKVLYHDSKEKKLQACVNQALTYYDTANAYLNSNQIILALDSYFKALNPVAKYITEPLQVDYQGRKIFLLNEIYNAVQNTLAQITLTAGNPAPLAAKTGKGLDSPLLIKALYNNKKNQPIANLPLTNTVSKGTANLTEQGQTDNAGTASIYLTKVLSREPVLLIKSEADLSRIIPQDSASVLFKTIVSSLVLPSVTVSLSVSGLSFSIDDKEQNFGAPVTQPIIASKLKSYLAEQSITFTDHAADADYVIVLQADTAKGSKLYNMFSSFATVTFSVVDRKQGKEIYKNTLTKIKGIDIDETVSGTKALENASKDILSDLDNNVLKALFR